MSAHGSARERNCTFLHNLLDDLEQIEGTAGEAVEHTEQFASVGARVCHLLAVDVSAAASGGTKLLKLAVECLPVGGYAGIADKPFFGGEFRS